MLDVYSDATVRGKWAKKTPGGGNTQAIPPWENPVYTPASRLNISFDNQSINQSIKAVDQTLTWPGRLCKEAIGFFIQTIFKKILIRMFRPDPDPEICFHRMKSLAMDWDKIPGRVRPVSCNRSNRIRLIRLPNIHSNFRPWNPMEIGRISWPNPSSRCWLDRNPGGANSRMSIRVQSYQILSSYENSVGELIYYLIFYFASSLYDTYITVFTIYLKSLHNMFFSIFPQFLDSLIPFLRYPRSSISFFRGLYIMKYLLDLV